MSPVLKNLLVQYRQLVPVPIIQSDEFLESIDDRYALLEFAMQYQTQSNWCWAALTASVSTYYNNASTWTQCKLASRVFGESSCCTTPSSSACNKDYYPAKSLQLTKNLNQRLDRWLDVYEIYDELSAGHVVGVGIDWKGGGGHAVAVSGVWMSDDYVLVKDPGEINGGDSVMRLLALINNYEGSGKWTETYETQSNTNS